MLWIAWKMLVGNRVTYLGIVFGVVFAALLIAQQASIFCGLMSLTVSQIRDVQGPGIWVMDEHVQFVDDIKPLADTDLYRVKGVTGVAWAVRFSKGIARARLEEGTDEQMILLGLDDATLVGAPVGIFMGSIADLRPASSSTPAIPPAGRRCSSVSRWRSPSTRRPSDAPRVCSGRYTSSGSGGWWSVRYCGRPVRSRTVARWSMPRRS